MPLKALMLDYTIRMEKEMNELESIKKREDEIFKDIAAKKRLPTLEERCELKQLHKRKIEELNAGSA